MITLIDHGLWLAISILLLHTEEKKGEKLVHPSAFQDFADCVELAGLFELK
jgi:hypothetical protein